MKRSTKSKTKPSVVGYRLAIYDREDRTRSNWVGKIYPESFMQRLLVCCQKATAKDAGFYFRREAMTLNRFAESVIEEAADFAETERGMQQPRGVRLGLYVPDSAGDPEETGDIEYVGPTFYGDPLDAVVIQRALERFHALSRDCYAVKKCLGVFPVE